MAWDLTVTLEDRPGMLAELGDALGRAGVNLGGAVGMTTDGVGTIHLLIEDDVDAAETAITGAGMSIDNRQEVLVVSVIDQPGTLASYANKLADAGVNINLMYVATATRLVFGVDDLEAARAAIA